MNNNPFKSHSHGSRNRILTILPAKIEPAYTQVGSSPLGRFGLQRIKRNIIIA